MAQAADGRNLEYLVQGPAAAPVLMFHVGTPNAATEFRSFLASASALGLRTVIYSRPGYGESSPRPGRTVADAIEDVETILDAIGATDFITLGWSGGGPHALACAALLPDRCRAAALLAGVAPYPSDGLDFMAGMDEENVAEFGAAIAGMAELTAFLQPQVATFGQISGEHVSQSLQGLLADVDRAALTGEFADDMAAALRRAVLHGIDGWRDDDLAFIQPWGFDVAQIETPVSVWQGGEDRMVPYAHGKWLATHLPTATSHLPPGHGHLSLIAEIDTILIELRVAAAANR
jgi:pimeloyl-ACP methyl ester carboxylesterase